MEAESITPSSVMVVLNGSMHVHEIVRCFRDVPCRGDFEKVRLILRHLADTGKVTMNGDGTWMKSS